MQTRKTPRRLTHRRKKDNTQIEAMKREQDRIDQLLGGQSFEWNDTAFVSISGG
jgi:hypothetical protein